MGHAPYMAASALVLGAFWFAFNPFARLGYTDVQAGALGLGAGLCAHALLVVVFG